jgi:CBS domain-containing membrane protein
MTIDSRQTAISTHPIDMSDDDILQAMKEIVGYIDITTGDFKEIYRLAYKHALKRLLHSIKTKNVMTMQVVSVDRNAPLVEVASLLADKGVSGVPVVDEYQRVVGVISEKDFIFQMSSESTGSFMAVIAHCLTNKGCVAISIRKQKAKDIMTSPAITVHDETPISKIGEIFSEKSINRVPVIGENDELVGIVTRADILQSYCILG